MFVVVPIKTDAPIYYWPKATVSLIIANVICFALTEWGNSTEGWILQFGKGYHPIEWVACNFLHFDFVHLLGNMIFLWGFGLVVEGKIGWKWFLPLYLGIGIAHAVIVQTCMLGYEGQPSGAGGASGVIYGLLAISLVWAPKNEITFSYGFFFFFILRGGTFELTILTFAMYYIGMEVLLAWLVHGFQVSSQMMHLLGAVLGFAVGVLMLKRNWVDCENWDLFAVLKGTYGNRTQLASYGLVSATHSGSVIPASEFPAGEDSQDSTDVAESRSAKKKRVLKRTRKLLDEGKPHAALAEFQSLKHLVSNWHLNEADLRALAVGLYQEQAWQEATPLLEEYIETFPANADQMRLMLAGISVNQQSRPKYALKLLDDIDHSELSEKNALHIQKITDRAHTLIEEGVIELEGQGWD
jgi:membrane associated rhomboid family serine protease